MDVAAGKGNPEGNRISPPPPLWNSGAKVAGFMLLIAAGYFVVARLSLVLAFEGTNATAVWPATGMALAAVVAFGYRAGPGIFVGAFFVNLLVLKNAGFSIPDSMVAALVTAGGNTLEAFVGSALIRRFSGGTYPFETVKDLSVFVVFGALLSTMISATTGVAIFCVHQGDWGLFQRLWLTWWLGDVTGAIVAFPACLAWKKLDAREWKPAHVAEAVVLCLLLSVVSITVFVGENPLRHLTLPVLLWVVLRFGLFEVSMSVALLSGLAIWNTIRSTGGAGMESLADSLLFLQSYIGVVGLTALYLSAVVRGRKRTERALRSEKSFVDTVIESVPGAFYVFDARGRLVRWNDFLERMNEQPDELQADGLRNVHEEDRALISSKIVEAFEKGQSEAEGRVYTRSGVRHFFFTGRRVDVDGAAYVVGTGTDVTARRLAELALEQNRRDLEKTIEQRTHQLTEANAALAREIEGCMEIERTLAESEKKYRDLVEGAHSVILRWTRDGTITFVNRFAREFFGYTGEEMVGRKIVGSIVPLTDSSKKSLASLADDVFENPEAYLLNENENIRKNGERVWISWTNKPVLDDEGKIVEMLSVGNDITSRKLAEDRLKITLEELAAARDRAEAADHVKSAFLATMSHELRTPLNSIIGFTGIMLKGYVGPLNEEQTKQMSMVQTSAQHLLSLINDVLDISKIESGQLQVSVDRVDLPALIRQSVESVRPTAEKKGLTLVVRISSDVAAIVSDRRRVEQILLNLLSNAIKFTEQGSIDVECTREADGSMTVSVTDSGIGIKEEDMGRLFKAFQQVDTGTTRKYEGTGLGLYICRKLAELLGGRMWVTSRWNEGSTFSFSLPGEGERSVK
jgi:PAS domain S-box-containing protein